MPGQHISYETACAIRAEGPINRKELARRYGVSEPTVYRVLRNLTQPDPTYIVPRFEHTTAGRKLTWEQVRAMRREFPRKSFKELADEHGCASSTVMLVIRNETYRDPAYKPKRKKRRTSRRPPSLQQTPARDDAGTWTSEIPPEGGTILPRAGGADYRIDRETGCWLWLRRIDQHGVPMAYRSRTVKHQRAHREYYRRAHGDLPSSVDLIKRCEGRGCVNPAHYAAVRHDQRLAAWHQEKSPLSWEDVREIRAGVKAGIKQEVFERRFGIANASVSKIVNNETWKDPGYEPGVEKECALPGCDKRFVTTLSSRAYCSRRHRAIYRWRYRIGYYDNQAERKAQRRAGNATRRAVERARSLDAPVHEESATTFGELVFGAGAHDVTFAEVEAGFVRELLGELTIDEVGRLDEEAVRSLRLALAEAGIAPPSVRHHVAA